MTGRIAVVIETKDRRLLDRDNFIGPTLRNFEETGGWSAPHLHSLTIVSGGEREDFFDTEIAPYVQTAGAAFEYVPCPAEGCTRQQNAARAIRAGVRTGAEWVIKLEDDLDFVHDFVEVSARWLDKHQRCAPMFVLGSSFQRASDSFYEVPGETVVGPGTSFPTARRLLAQGVDVVASSVSGFWGAQALAWPHDWAEHLVTWLGDDPFFPGRDGKQHRDRGHDLLLQRWGFTTGARAFATALPSFVQHIGRQSNLNNRFFEFAWPGRGWRYDA